MSKKKNIRSDDDMKFEVRYEDNEGQEHVVVCRIDLPNIDQLNEAQKVYNTAFRAAIDSRALLRPKLNDFVREQGLWDDAKDAELQTLRHRMDVAERKLKGGNIKLSEAHALAIEMREIRAAMRQLLAVQNELDSMTAESQAENAKFQYLVSACTVYDDTGNRVFSDVSDYLNPSIPAFTIAAAAKYASLLYGVSEDFEETLPENNFLRQYGFVDKNLRLINKEGRLVDTKGRTIDELGNFVGYDEAGNTYPVDGDGNPLDEHGHLIITDTMPFLDDNGKPIEPPEPEEEEVEEEITEIKGEESPEDDSPPAQSDTE